jgi:hypothetical protein
MEKDKVKYYTPEMDEIFTGLECEVKNDDGEWQKYNFAKRVRFLDFLQVVLFTKHLKNNAVRAKCLDKDDIEECGWRQMGEDYQYIIDVDNSNREVFVLWFVGDVDKIKIFYKTLNGNYELDHFRGTIKNKAELKFIMKRVGIL